MFNLIEHNAVKLHGYHHRLSRHPHIFNIFIDSFKSHRNDCRQSMLRFTQRPAQLDTAALPVQPTNKIPSLKITSYKRQACGYNDLSLTLQSLRQTSCDKPNIIRRTGNSLIQPACFIPKPACKSVIRHNSLSHLIAHQYNCACRGF